MDRSAVSYMHLPWSNRLERVTARQARKKSHRFLRWIVIAFLALGLCYALWNLGSYLLGKTFLAIKAIDVKGLNYLQRSEIDQALEGVNLESFLNADLDGIKERLLSLDYIADVKTEKVYPNHLVIDVQERLPVAYCMQGGKLIALSSDGYNLPVDARLGAPVMPLFVGEAHTANQTNPQTDSAHNMLAILGILKSRLPMLFAEVESVNVASQTLRMTDGTSVICGWHNTFEDLSRLSAVRSLLAAQGEKASSFDLRYGNQVVVRGLPYTATPATMDTTKSGSIAPEIISNLNPPMVKTLSIDNKVYPVKEKSHSQVPTKSKTKADKASTSSNKNDINKTTKKNPTSEKTGRKAGR